MFKKTFTNELAKFQTFNDVFKVKGDNGVEVIEKYMKKFLNIKEDSTNFTVLA